MKKLCQIFFSSFILASCLALISCGPEESNAFSSQKKTLQKKTQDLATQINKEEWKTIADEMIENFSFQYGDKTYQGDKKGIGGKPFKDSIKRKDFIFYTHTITDIKKRSATKYTVDANATLELSYKISGRQQADWPVRFTWIREGKDWRLSSVQYLEKRKFNLTKQEDKKATPKTDIAPVRAYSTQEAASSISNKINYGSGNATQQKAKRSIKNKMDELNKKNR